MSEGATARRVAIGLAISAFVLAAVALVVALARRGAPDSVPIREPIAQAPAPEINLIHRLDAMHAVIARATADRLIANPADLAAVHEMPGVGFLLVSIPPKGPLEALGFEAGDLIRGVNGMDVATPAGALQMVTQLKSTTRFTIDLERKGSALQLTIEIR
jgi:S1-C subfamily serine protease